MREGPSAPPKSSYSFEYGSTCTYLSVARIGRLAPAQGVTVDWQPFFLMPILAEQGMNLGPFLPCPNKMEYMWRDIERRAKRAGLACTRPSTSPVNSLLTARVACIAAAEGWCRPFTEKVFALHWTENRLIGTDDNLESALASLGQEPATLKARARTPEGKEALKQQTEVAKSLRIFGAPSFVAGGELFWGDDRLEQAIEWAASH